MVEKAGGGKRHFWKNPWWFIAALIAFVWVILALGDRPPTVRLTCPAPPNPNAYDYYIRATDQLLEQANKTKIGRPIWSGGDMEQENRYTTAQKLTHVTELAPYARSIHEGFRYRCLVTDNSMDVISGYAKLRTLERYLNFAARTEAAVGTGTPPCSRHWIV